MKLKVFLGESFGMRVDARALELDIFHAAINKQNTARLRPV